MAHNIMRATKLYTHKGEIRSLKDFSNKYNIDVKVVRGRLYNNWDLKKALTTPVAKPYPIIIGQRFTRLEIIDEFRTKGTYKNVLCVCDCGNLVWTHMCVLHAQDTKSCGCYSSDQAASRAWTGYEEISGQYIGAIKDGARRRNMLYDIRPRDMWKKFLQQDRKCALTGVELLFSTRCSSKEQTASLDRINSTIGYVVSNIQWVHKDINKIKMNLDESIFINWCRLTVQHRG